MNRQWIRVAALCLVLVMQQAWAAEKGTLSKAEELKAEPYRDAKTLKSLAAGEKVEIVGRDGGWYKVKVGKGSGWVRMLSVRKGDAKAKASEASGLLALSSGRAGTGKVVATTGIRGLNEEELRAAKFNGKELQQAESYAVSRADARKFAQQGKLAPRPFDYLPDAQ